MNGFDMIDPDTLEKIKDPFERDKLFLNYLRQINDRLSAMEDGKWIHRGLSMCGGVAGGFAGVLTYWYFFKGALG